LAQNKGLDNFGNCCPPHSQNYLKCTCCGRVVLYFIIKFISYCISAGEDRFVYLWNVRTNKMEKMIAAHSIADLKFDEEYLYTASSTF
jgi:hypothetical protein